MTIVMCRVVCGFDSRKTGKTDNEQPQHSSERKLSQPRLCE